MVQGAKRAVFTLERMVDRQIELVDNEPGEAVEILKQAFVDHAPAALLERRRPDQQQPMDRFFRGLSTLYEVGHGRHPNFTT